MGSVVGSQFGEDVLDSALDAFFADRELLGDLFVGIPSGNQTQDAYFRRGQGIIGDMLGELKGGLRRKSLFPAWTARIISRSSLWRRFFSR